MGVDESEEKMEIYISIYLYENCLLFIPTNSEKLAVGCLVDQERWRGPDRRGGETSLAVGLGDGGRGCK